MVNARVIKPGYRRHCLSFAPGKLGTSISKAIYANEFPTLIKCAVNVSLPTNSTFHGLTSQLVNFGLVVLK